MSISLSPLSTLLPIWIEVYPWDLNRTQQAIKHQVAGSR